MQAANEPTDEQIAAAEYGGAPDPEKLEAGIRAWGDDNLKDPSSLQIRRVSTPYKGWMSQCVIPGPYGMCQKRMFYFGHVVTAETNAKNSYGGYTGFKPTKFLFRGNTVVRVIGDD